MGQHRLGCVGRQRKQRERMARLWRTDRSSNRSLLRRCSIGLFAVTALKVLIKDMVNVSTPYRIVSFMVLGLMLIGASYLYHRYKSRILPAGGTQE